MLTYPGDSRTQSSNPGHTQIQAKLEVNYLVSLKDCRYKPGPCQLKVEAVVCKRRNMCIEE